MKIKNVVLVPVAVIYKRFEQHLLTILNENILKYIIEVKLNDLSQKYFERVEHLEVYFCTDLSL